MKFFVLLVVFFLFCFRPPYNVCMDEPIPDVDDYHLYAEDSTLFFMCFSGGGTRAACMSWEVLKYFKSISCGYNWGGGEEIKVDMADKIDFISGTSGGSFSAAAWLLYSDSMEVFDRKFIRTDIQKNLVLSLLATPQAWLSPYYNRIDVAAKYYDENVFGGCEFGDLPARPKLWVNATHLALGVRFVYTWDYFSLLNSDLSDYGLAYACAASSAFPVLLDPITLINYSQRLPDSVLMEDVGYKLAVLNSGSDSESFYYKRKVDFFNNPKNRYNHIADGGIVDNRGLKVVLDQFQTGGYINRCFNNRQLKRLVFVNVSAWTDKPDNSCVSEKPPNELQVVKYSASSPIDQLSEVLWQRIKDKSVEMWQASEDLDIDMESPYFIEISFRDIKDEYIRDSCYSIPTSFNLSANQIDLIRSVVPGLIEANSDFKRLSHDF